MTKNMPSKTKKAAPKGSGAKLTGTRPAQPSPPPPQAADAESLRQLLDEVRRLRKENEELRAPSPSASATYDAPTPVAKELPQDVRADRESFARNVPVPGRNAPSFNLVNDFLSFGAAPWAESLMPAYLLDKNYRIVDWNLPFSLAFDRTMEGRRGLSVLEWVYFLDNYEESLKKAAVDFGDPANLPRLHVETMLYTSPRYGPITATKRAYQLPKDDGQMLGWLVTLDPAFADEKTTLRFKRDLFALMRHDMAWSEYALSYDRVLLETKVYRELLNHVLGEAVPPGGSGALTPIPPRSRILDLGAGTGNIARTLADQRRGHVIFALENNRVMLDLLRTKCGAYLRADDNGPGILPIKQDVNSLYGLPDSDFDFAILNNVAYTLDDPLPCFRQVHKALVPQGEIRVSGPQKKTNLQQLFAHIEADLGSKMAELREDYDRMLDINRNILSSTLYRWTVEDMTQMLLSAGFQEIGYATDAAYGGQAMIVVARA